MRNVFTIAGLATVVAFGLFVSGTATAQKKGESRPLLTKDLMKGLNQLHCGALGKELKSDEPNWEKARMHAALLNEVSYILMADGRCPSAEWAEGAKTLRECSTVVLEKIEAEDKDGAQGAFQALTKGCQTCHKAHKE